LVLTLSIILPPEKKKALLFKAEPFFETLEFQFSD